MAYDIGDTVRSTCTFTNLSAAATDPTTVTVKYLSSDGTLTSKVYLSDVEVVRSGAGVFYIDIAVNRSGRWYVKWFGTGTVAAATPDEVLTVTDSVF